MFIISKTGYNRPEMANNEKISAVVYDAKMEKPSKIAKIVFTKANNGLINEYLD